MSLQKIPQPQHAPVLRSEKLKSIQAIRRAMIHNVIDLHEKYPETTDEKVAEFGKLAKKINWLKFVIPCFLTICWTLFSYYL